MSAVCGHSIAADAPGWEKEIAPLLKQHCVKCHGPAKAEGKLNLATGPGVLRGGEDGPVIAPHELDKSLMWKRVSAGEMPPEMPLAEPQQELLRRWILAGAPGLKEAGESSGPGREGDHWAFRKLVPTPLPDSVDKVASPIDAFIAARLAPHKLEINAPTSRLTLLRRLSLDLLGLPPRREEIAAYLADESPDAYERQVDRYLASPHYGERWGKYWLDAAGYADSNGYFNADSDRPLAYRYRDYVLRSLNRDLPFDQFIRQQLAGDELAAFSPGDEATPETIELLEATHYVRNGQDGSGESDGNPDEVRIDRYTALESSMQIAASSLLGLTMQCAKCHDHKFEPITQRDYYQFQAILYPVFNLEQWQKPNERFVLAPLPGQREAWEKRQQELAADIARQKNGLSLWAREHRPRGEPLLEETFDGPAEKLAEVWSSSAPGDDAPGGTPAVTINSDSAPGAALAGGKLKILEGGSAGNRWLSTRQAFDWTPAAQGDAIQVTFDLVDNKASPDGPVAARIGYYIATHDFSDNSSVPGGNLLLDGNPAGSTPLHLDYPGSDSKLVGEIGTTPYAPGGNFGVRVTNVGKGKFRLEHLAEGIPEEKSATLTAEDLPDGGFAWEYCCGRSFIVDNLRIERFAAGSATSSAEPPEFATELKKRREQLDTLLKQRDEMGKQPPGKISWATDISSQPPQVFLLERGNYAARKDQVFPAPPAILSPPDSPFIISPPSQIAKTTGTRLALANWLTAPDSRAAALAARVQANRLWQHHFGTGIVSTPENLGISGSPPSHPELLEWLAGSLIRSQWSFKSLHRQILLSATYRQSSSVSEAALRHDADGRLLSRYPLRRLDGEAIRDSMLAAGGDLDERFFGPYVPTTRDGAGEVLVPEDAPGARRRSLYLYQRRTQVVSLLAVFDTPSIVFNSLSRPRSTMPLQALSLLNSQFAASRASYLADRLREQHPADQGACIQAAYLQILSRPPTQDEAATANEFLQAQSATYAGDAAAGKLALADLCQMLLASNEFLYLE